MAHMLQFAADNDVRLTVFDGEDELIKIARMGCQSKFDLLLRLATNDKSSICQFSKKFGCAVDDARHLLTVAKDLGLHVAGVSFHVGSGCGDPAAYTLALHDAATVFEVAKELGMPEMTIIDIGGGFPGDDGEYGGPSMPTFAELAKAIRDSIVVIEERLDIGQRQPIRYIAEPGRFFVASSTVVATKVFARKGGAASYQALYVDDGVYGTFNNIIYDHATPKPKKLLLAKTKAYTDFDMIPSAVFGPTCDGLDQMNSMDKTKLPRCEIGDWLVWENMGAYTHTASFVFNGYDHIPNKWYCIF
jgi:diaminopimelate decarboxylase